MRPRLLGSAVAALSAAFAAAADTPPSRTAPPVPAAQEKWQPATAPGAARTIFGIGMPAGPVSAVAPVTPVPVATLPGLPEVVTGPDATPVVAPVPALTLPPVPVPVPAKPVPAALPAIPDAPKPATAPLTLPPIPAAKVPIPAAKVPAPAPPAPTVVVPPAPVVAQPRPTELPVVPPPKAVVPPGPTPPNTLPAMPAAGPPAAAAAPMAATPPAPYKFHDDHLGPWNTVWVRGGYNYLWIKDAPVAPVVAATGALGNNNPGTRILLGRQDVEYDGFSGGSVEGGVWVDERHTVGFGLSGFITDRQSTMSVVGTDGSAGSGVIVRPFFNPLLGGLGGQDALLVAAPGRFAGTIAVETAARLAGGEAYALINLCNTKAWTANLSVGFRYFDLDETLTVSQVTRGLNGNTIPFFGAGTQVAAVAVTDRVRTRNQFYGGQVGGDFEYRTGPVFVNLGTKVGLGPVHQVVEVTGETRGPGGASGPGGFLAAGTPPNGNIGRSTTNYFGVLSDTNAMVGVYVSSRVRLGFGYEFLYLNTVARPGRQLGQTIDPRSVPVTASFGGRAPSSTLVGGPGTPPLNPIDRDDFFAHGLKFLFEFQY